MKQIFYLFLPILIISCNKKKDIEQPQKIYDNITFEKDDKTPILRLKIDKTDKGFDIFQKDTSAIVEIPYLSSFSIGIREFNVDNVRIALIKPMNGDKVINYGEALSLYINNSQFSTNSKFFIETNSVSKFDIDYFLGQKYNNEHRLFLHLTKSIELETFNFLKSVITKYQFEEVYIACVIGDELRYIDFRDWNFLEWEAIGMKTTL